MNKPVLECNGIAAGYVKDLDILQGVDLVVNQNEIVSIIGPNGAGKSTLLKAIMGIINISAGRFYINGIEKTKTPTHKIVKEGVAYVPQVENVFPSLTISQFHPSHQKCTSTLYHGNSYLRFLRQQQTNKSTNLCVYKQNIF